MTRKNWRANGIESMTGSRPWEAVSSWIKPGSGPCPRWVADPHAAGLISNYPQWLSKAQDLMSTMASNYDMGRLHLGEALMALITCSLLFAVTTSLIPLVVVSISYGIMMFASSYVEEEQHFWYWFTSAWFGSLAIKNMQT